MIIVLYNRMSFFECIAFIDCCLRNEILLLHRQRAVNVYQWIAVFGSFFIFEGKNEDFISILSRRFLFE